MTLEQFRKTQVRHRAHDEVAGSQICSSSDTIPAMSLTRRQFIWAASASGLTWPVFAAARQRTEGGAFRHGVASGDPQNNGVILWTRLTPSDPSTSRPLNLRWRRIKPVSWAISLARVVKSVCNRGCNCVMVGMKESILVGCRKRQEYPLFLNLVRMGQGMPCPHKTDFYSSCGP